MIGPVASLRLFGTSLVWLTGPEVIKEALQEKRDRVTKFDDFTVAFGKGLLVTSGEQWERQRNSMLEFFNSNRIRSFGDGMVSRCAAHCDWDHSDEILLLEEMQDLTL